MTATPPVVPDVMDPGLIADPVGGYGRLREQAPVLRGRAPDGSAAWFVTRQADVRTVLGMAVNEEMLVGCVGVHAGDRTQTTTVERRQEGGNGAARQRDFFVADRAVNRVWCAGGIFTPVMH